MHTVGGVGRKRLARDNNAGDLGINILSAARVGLKRVNLQRWVCKCVCMLECLGVLEPSFLLSRNAWACRPVLLASAQDVATGLPNLSPNVSSSHVNSVKGDCHLVHEAGVARVAACKRPM